MCKKLIYLISFVLVLCIASNASADLLVHWTLEEGSGTTAFDISGNGYDGEFSSEPQWVEGHGGGSALQFDGVDDFVVYSFDEVQTFATFSVALWVKADTLGQPNYCSAFSSHFPNTAGFQVDVDGGNPGNYRINPDSGNQFAFGTATTDWIHLALTTEGTSMNLYYNGNWASSNILVDNDVVFNQFAIGVNRNRNWWFACTIDDLRVYDHILSEAEILSTMAGEPWPYAFGPEPADGVMHEDTWVNLAWKPGDLAVSHDVYLGENFDDVNSGAEGTFQGNQAGTFLVVGFPGFPFPD
ncbi:MAG: LamG domain-containing protein, partial [Phycisphaerae bacterium]